MLEFGGTDDLDKWWGKQLKLKKANSDYVKLMPLDKMGPLAPCPGKSTIFYYCPRKRPFKGWCPIIAPQRCFGMSISWYLTIHRSTKPCFRGLGLLQRDPAKAWCPMLRSSIGNPTSTSNPLPACLFSGGLQVRATSVSGQVCFPFFCTKCSDMCGWSMMVLIGAAGT